MCSTHHLVPLSNAVNDAVRFDVEHRQCGGYSMSVSDYSSIYDRAICGELLPEQLLRQRALQKSVPVVDLIAISSSRRELAFVEFKWCISSGASLRKLTKKVVSTYALTRGYLNIGFTPERYKLLLVVDRGATDIVLNTLTDMFRTYIRERFGTPYFSLRAQPRLDWRGTTELRTVLVIDERRRRTVAPLVVDFKTIDITTEIQLVLA